MKPEAGQWWVNDKFGDKVYFIGRCANGIMVFQVEGNEIEHGDFDWSGWRLMQPQPAEDHDEWVVLDPVKYADHVPRVGIDEWSNPGTGWYLQKPSHHLHTVGVCNQAYGTIHRCRRRDLPKVEQAEQWPKYYKPSQPRKTGYGKHVAYYKCIETEKGETVHTDGTSFGFTVRAPGLDWTEITEEQAMWLLDKPTEPESKPQPQKTRVRLWARPDGGHIWFCPDRPANGSWLEIHHDSEGFYVEGGQP